MAQTLHKHKIAMASPNWMLFGLTTLLWMGLSTRALASSYPVATVSLNNSSNSALMGATDQTSNPIQDSIWMDSVQKQTIKYFWDFAHPTSGLARERSNIAYDYGNEVVTTGGSGMGFMAVIISDITSYRTGRCLS